MKRVKTKAPPFVPAFPRDVCVKSIAIWSLRDDGLNENQTIRVIQKAGYARCEARWGIAAARQWLEEQKSKPAKTTKELVAAFGS